MPKISLEDYKKLPIEERFKLIMAGNLLDEEHKKKQFCLIEDNYHEAKQWIEKYERKLEQ